MSCATEGFSARIAMVLDSLASIGKLQSTAVLSFDRLALTPQVLQNLAGHSKPATLEDRKRICQMRLEFRSRI